MCRAKDELACQKARERENLHKNDKAGDSQKKIVPPTQPNPADQVAQADALWPGEFHHQSQAANVNQRCVYRPPWRGGVPGRWMAAQPVNSRNQRLRCDHEETAARHYQEWPCPGDLSLSNATFDLRL